MGKGKKEGKKAALVSKEILGKEEVRKVASRIGVEPPNILVTPSLRIFLFSYFKKSLEEGKFPPPKEEVGEEVEKRYPNSIFPKKLEKHYSYYKSSFLTLYKLGAISISPKS